MAHPWTGSLTADNRANEVALRLLSDPGLCQGVPIYRPFSRPPQSRALQIVLAICASELAIPLGRDEKRTSNW